MERLIKDAQKLDSSFVAQKKRNGELTMSYADIVKAIHIVQENMNIAGTTEKEAAATIQGALFMTKSAWQNLITAFGKGEGVNDAMKALTGSAKILVKNILPVVKRVLSGVADAVKEIAPTIIEYLPDLVSEILPSLLSAAATLFGAVIKAIPGILKSLYTVFESFLDSFESWLETKAPKLAAAFRAVRETVKNVFSGISTWWEKNLGPSVEKAEGIIGKISGAFDSIKKYIEETLIPAVKDAWENNAAPVYEAVSGAIQSISDAWSRIKTVLQPVIDKVIELKDKFVEYVTGGKAANDTTNLVVTAVNLLSTAIIKVAEFISDLVTTIADFAEKIGPAFEAVKSKAIEMKNSVINSWRMLKTNVANYVNTLKTNITTAWENAKTSVVDTVEGIKSNLEEKWSSIKKTAETWWGNIKKAIVSPIESAKTSISTAIDNIKRLFKGEIKLNIKLPHITWGTKIVTILGKAIEVPDLNIEWYKKAYNTPYLFTEPTVVGGLGFGDGQGGEMVYGHDNLMRDISAATRDDERMDIIIELLRYIVQNGVNANFNRNQMYKTMASMNRSRSYATGYNGFSGV